MPLPDLSEDLLIDILHHLAPEDVLAVRATCRLLAIPTYRRVAWLKLFNDIQQTYGVLDGTFDIPALTRDKLEAMALRPSRYARLIRHNQVPMRADSLMEISSTSVELPPSLNTENSLPGFFKAFLIPGGRFLVTDYGRRLVQIWDLDKAKAAEPGTYILHPQSIAAFELEFTNQSELSRLACACVRPDRKALRIVVTVQGILSAISGVDGPSGMSEVLVYEWFPAEPNSFVLFKKLTLYSRRFSFLAFDGSSMVLSTLEALGGRRKTIVWPLDVNTLESVIRISDIDVDQATIRKDLLATVHSRELIVRLWAIPPLDDMQGDQPSVRLDLRLLAEVPFDTYRGSMYCTICDEGDLVVVKRCRAHHNTPASIETIIAPLPNGGEPPALRSNSFTPGNYGFDAHRSPHGFAVGDYWLTVWSEQTVPYHYIYVSVTTPLRSNTGEGLSTKHTQILEFGGSCPAILECTLCPVSQRTVLLDSQGDICVLSYPYPSIVPANAI